MKGSAQFGLGVLLLGLVFYFGRGKTERYEVTARREAGPVLVEVGVDRQDKGEKAAKSWPDRVFRSYRSVQGAVEETFDWLNAAPVRKEEGAQAKEARAIYVDSVPPGAEVWLVSDGLKGVEFLWSGVNAQEGVVPERGAMVAREQASARGGGGFFTAYAGEAARTTNVFSGRPAPVATRVDGRRLLEVLGGPGRVTNAPGVSTQGTSGAVVTGAAGMTNGQRSATNGLQMTARQTEETNAVLRAVDGGGSGLEGLDKAEAFAGRAFDPTEWFERFGYTDPGSTLTLSPSGTIHLDRPGQKPPTSPYATHGEDLIPASNMHWATNGKWMVVTNEPRLVVKQVVDGNVESEGKVYVGGRSMSGVRVKDGILLGTTPLVISTNLGKSVRLCVVMGVKQWTQSVAALPQLRGWVEKMKTGVPARAGAGVRFFDKPSGGDSRYEQVADGRGMIGALAYTETLSWGNRMCALFIPDDVRASVFFPLMGKVGPVPKLGEKWWRDKLVSPEDAEEALECLGRCGRAEVVCKSTLGGARYWLEITRQGGVAKDRFISCAHYAMIEDVKLHSVTPSEE